MLRSRRESVIVLALVACSLMVRPAFLPAQTGSSGSTGSSFLFINQERILTQSRSGRALLQDEERAREELRAEARTIDQEFEAEERRLTELRSETDPEEFRALADEFDARVVAAREEQDRRSDELAQEIERNRRQFYARVAPVLVELMDEFGALAIFDENSVLLADQSLNITDAVIDRIDSLQSDVERENAGGDNPREETDGDNR